MRHVVIIGNGISGITAARHIRKNSDFKITIISSESDFFFSRTALMYIYMGHMKFEHTKPYEDHFWAKNRLNLIRDHVNEILPSSKKIILESQGELTYDTLIIATGSKPNKFGWPGEDLEGVQGLYSKQDLESLETNAPDNKRCKRAVIVGGGLIGIELAEMLRTREIPVTFLVRENSFWNGVLPSGDSELLNQHIREHHIDLRLNTNLVEILKGENERACGVVTDRDEHIPCDLVGLTAGVRPNIDFLKNSGIETNKGVLVNRFLETNVPHVFAIGDCAEQREAHGRRKNIEAVWYTGRIMGETVAQTITGNRSPYTPGHWFNSAKFFDIEYQTYGWVSPEKNRPDYEVHFHWRHPKNPICLTMAYHRTTGEFLGLNTFGIRMRHTVVAQWLTDKQRITDVVHHLRQANFDPEFYTRYEPQIQTAFNLNNPVFS